MISDRSCEHDVYGVCNIVYTDVANIVSYRSLTVRNNVEVRRSVWDKESSVHNKPIDPLKGRGVNWLHFAI